MSMSAPINVSPFLIAALFDLLILLPNVKKRTILVFSDNIIFYFFFWILWNIFVSSLIRSFLLIEVLIAHDFGEVNEEGKDGIWMY